MTSVRRATGPLLAAWLVATFGAVWVAWFSVHPVTELGFGKRPAVPRPEIADSPPYDSNDPSESLSRHVRNPAADRPTGTSPRPWTTGAPSLTKKPSPSPPTGSVTPSPVTPSTGTSTVYREASADGGTATFEYTEEGDVNLFEVRPNPGWRVIAYRYSRDWLEVEFSTYGRRSIMVAYLDRGLARVYTIEQ